MKKNEYKLTDECRSFAEKGDYKNVLELINKNPETLYLLTVGELNRYCGRGFEKKEITQEDINKLKKNIEKIIFGEGILE